MTTRTSRSASAAAHASRCPGRNPGKPKRSRSALSRSGLTRPSYLARRRERARRCEMSRGRDQMSQSGCKESRFRPSIALDSHERPALRSEERRVGKSVDLGGRRVLKKKKEKK